MAPSPSRTRPGGPGAAAFFDLDKTIIASSSTLAFARPFRAGGLITRRVLLRQTVAHVVFQLSGLDHDQMERLRRQVSALVTGWEVQHVQDIVRETLEEMIRPMVYQEATALIAEHHAAGRDVVVVSAGGAEVVEPIGRMLGADRVVATRMVVQDGRYTGELAFYAYAEGKAEAIRGLAAEHGYDLDESFAYSDSVTDLPMLELVGHPHAVNPDRALRREAVTRGWPVLDFSRPVGLGGRLPAPSRRVLVAVLAAAAATAGTGVGVAVGLRRRSLPAG